MHTFEVSQHLCTNMLLLPMLTLFNRQATRYPPLGSFAPLPLLVGHTPDSLSVCANKPRPNTQPAVYRTLPLAPALPALLHRSNMHVMFRSNRLHFPPTPMILPMCIINTDFLLLPVHCKIVDFLPPCSDCITLLFYAFLCHLPMARGYLTKVYWNAKRNSRDRACFLS